MFFSRSFAFFAAIYNSGNPGKIFLPVPFRPKFPSLTLLWKLNLQVRFYNRNPSQRGWFGSTIGTPRRGAGSVLQNGPPRRGGAGARGLLHSSTDSYTIDSLKYNFNLNRKGKRNKLWLWNIQLHMISVFVTH
jgi:hypothetical protein